MIIRLFVLGALLMSPLASSMEFATPPLCRRLEDRNPDYEALRGKIGKNAAALGFGLAAHLKDKSPNRVSSPWSLYAVLAQLVPGARGETEQELSTLLYGAKAAPTEPAKEGGTLATDSDLDRMSDAIALVGCPDPYSKSITVVANRIFVDKKVVLQPEYTKTLEGHFDTTTGRVDFQKDKKAAVREINAWVARQTKKRITELVTEDAVGRDTKVVLANTLYLKAAWSAKFDKKQTTPGEFRLTKRKKIQTPMMRLKGKPNEFVYAKIGDTEALRTEFADGKNTFLVILPEKIDGMTDLEKKLNEGFLAEIEKKLEPRSVNFVLPRFKTSNQYELVKPLEKMGVKAAFIPGKADFTGIDGGTNQLVVGAILQKVTVEVDETGFEGAAATAAMMRVGGGPPKPTKPVDFIADRPFLFLVQNNATGAVLFQGVVSDPSVRN